MKDAYYFPHDCTARNDVKMLKLRRILGAQGYGLFWMMIEVLRESEGYKLPISAIKELSFDFRESEELILTIVKDFELFTIDEDYFFYSEDLIKRMKPLEAKRKALSEAGKKGRQKQLELGIGAQPVTTPGPPPGSKLKESKGKYSNFYEEQIEISENHCQYSLFVSFIYGTNLLEKKYARVLAMKDQLTFDQFNKLQEKISFLNKHERSKEKPDVKLSEMLTSYENGDYKHNSVYLTMNNWINREAGRRGIQ